jgi:hypothetical protein
MEKFLKLHQNLERCYLKISFIQYVTSSDEVKENTCKLERDALVEYLNSDALNHENILKDKIKYLKSNFFLFLYINILDKQEKAVSGNYHL